MQSSKEDHYLLSEKTRDSITLKSMTASKENSKESRADPNSSPQNPTCAC